jgi:hypothetical protein
VFFIIILLLLLLKNIYIYILLLLLLLLFGQVDQQDVPITGQPSKRQIKKKQNDQTTKQSLRINRTIPTHTKQLASYCRSLMRGLK